MQESGRDEGKRTNREKEERKEDDKKEKGEWITEEMRKERGMGKKEKD